MEYNLVERVIALEVHMSSMSEEQRETNKKLDELLALRHKGAGAFWLASGLMGTGIIGFIISMMEYFKHG